MKSEDSYDNVRKGKWTTEEENYSGKIISMFNMGMLPIPTGTTLRSYLSEKLSCDPMRITKKFAGASCIGKQVFHPCDHSESTQKIKLENEIELAKFEKLFLARLHSKAACLQERHQQQTQGTVQAPVTPSQSPNGRGTKNKHNPAFDTVHTSTAPASSSFGASSIRRGTSAPVHHSPESDEGFTSNSTSFSSDGNYCFNESFSSSGSQADAYSTSGGVFQKNKRIMSAPDLTQMSMFAASSSTSGTSTGATVSLSSSATEENCLGIAYKTSSSAGAASLFNTGGSNAAYSSRKSPAKLPKGRQTGLRSSSTQFRTSNSSGSFGHHSRSSSGGSSSVKKSHSMMDLVNYENFAQDDMLAGTLFYEFVQQLGDKYQGPTERDRDSFSSDHTPSETSSLHTVPSETLLSTATSTSTHNLTGPRQNPMASTGTTPSPNAACYILNQFMTIDDVISATVAQDFSSFSVSEQQQTTQNTSFMAMSQVPPPSQPPALSVIPTLPGLGSGSRASLSNFLQNDSPLLLSSQDLQSLGNTATVPHMSTSTELGGGSSLYTNSTKEFFSSQQNLSGSSSRSPFSTARALSSALSLNLAAGGLAGSAAAGGGCGQGVGTSDDLFVDQSATVAVLSPRSGYSCMVDNDNMF